MVNISREKGMDEWAMGDGGGEGGKGEREREGEPSACPTVPAALHAA